MKPQKDCTVKLEELNALLKKSQLEGDSSHGRDGRGKSDKECDMSDRESSERERSKALPEDDR